MSNWEPFPGCHTKQIINRIYLLEYDDKINFVYRYGNKPTPINIIDLTVLELNAIIDTKKKLKI